MSETSATDARPLPIRPLRILEVETFGHGGLLHYSYNLSRALGALGHDVTLLTTVGYELAGENQSAGLRIERRIARWSQREPERSSRPWLRRFEAVFDAIGTAWFARKLAPDVVHLHSTNSSAGLYLLLLRVVGLRVASTAHVVTPHEPMRLQNAIYGWIHRLPQLLIAHSRVDRERLVEELRVRRERIEVIPHGEYGFFGDTATGSTRRSESRERLGLESDEEVVLFFGYIREYKGLDLLLDAWPAVREMRSRARLLVVGNPERIGTERRAELERQARSLGAFCRFEYVPFDEVSQYFEVADLLVMPYRRISQSGVLFLALSLGVPVVASRVGALPEMLSEGVDAVLVPPDDIEALATALAEVLADPGFRSRLAEAGKRVAAAHSWPTIAETTAVVFRELAGRPHPTA